jgi:hypothetical protein
VEKVGCKLEQGQNLSRVLLRSCTILNFDISLLRAAFGKNVDIDSRSLY